MPGRLIDTLSPRAAPPAAPASAMDHIKRGSLAGLASHIKPHHHEKRLPSKDRAAVPNAHRPSASPSLQPAKFNNALEIVVESPPNIFYGNPATSSGALFSGQLRVRVDEPEITLSSFSMTFLACITALKPVAKDCQACAVKTTQLFRWTFLTEPKTLKTGQHSFPFSYLIPGHLPATTFGHLGRLEYVLDARARTVAHGDLTLRQPLSISRALPPIPDKTSVRIFPPTNLSANLQFPPMLHPIGQFPALLRITGISSRSPHDPNIQLRWRLRKLSWRLEEIEKMVSPACDKHASKVGGAGRGVMHEDASVVGHDEMKEGWKTDFNDGSIEMEILISCNSERPLCDVDSPTGLSITHSLVIELVTAEEWAPIKFPSRNTPTGAARVLRAQFQVAITERSGMGISWDEEQPPTYDDVPASPPLYSGPTGRLRSESFPISPLDDLEELSLNELRRPRADPASTERGRPTERITSPDARARELRAMLEEENEADRPRSPPPPRTATPSPVRVSS